MATIKLTDAEVVQKLADLNTDTRRSWQLVDGKLKKQFEFGSFILAFAFMTKVAMLAETLNHHPESNVYGRVALHRWCFEHREALRLRGID